MLLDKDKLQAIAYPCFRAYQKFIQVNNYEIAVKFFRIHHNDIQQLFTNLSEFTQFVQLMN